MRKIMTIAIACAMTLTASATKLTQGSLNVLKDQKNICVTLDLSKTVYKKDKTVQDFLNKAYRVADWKDISMREFVNEFNEHAYRSGATVTTTAGGKYEMQIIPATLTGGGQLKDVTVNIIDKTSGQNIATLTLDSHDGDDDDDEGLKDAIEDLGKQLGKFFNSKVK